MLETAQLMRPLFARAVAEHDALVTEAGAERYIRRNGWLKLYRSDRSFAGAARELEMASRLGIAMSHSMVRRPALSNRRWRRYSATRCIGPGP